MAGRPRGRRAEQITGTAARLFRERGYHATSLYDIARAEGVTGGSIYRHFAGKEDLLTAVVTRGVRRVADRLGQADRESLVDVVRGGGRAVIDDLDAVVVFLRDGHHLSADRLRPVIELARANNNVMIDAVRAARPALSRRHVGFMLQSLAGMYLSLVHLQPLTARTRIEEIWTAMGTAALMGAPDVPIDVGRARSSNGVSAARASRREAILGEAAVLFRQRGFGGVGIDEIGAAAGIAGPAVYRHFESKDELLAATISRASEQLAAGAAMALAADDPLDALIGSYVRIAIDHADTFAVYLAEVDSLSPDRRRVVRRDNRAYLDEWQALLGRLVSGASADDIRVAVHAALGLVNGYAVGQVRPPADVAAVVLNGMMRAALDAFVGSS